MQTAYQPEPFTNFSIPENKAAMEAALQLVASEKGRHYPLKIAGKAIDTEARITSVNPSCFAEVIGTVARANAELADQAVKAAQDAFASWKHVAPEVRARLLFKAAAILRRRKFEYSAWLVEEEPRPDWRRSPPPPPPPPHMHERGYERHDHGRRDWERRHDDHGRGHGRGHGQNHQ